MAVRQTRTEKWKQKKKKAFTAYKWNHINVIHSKYTPRGAKIILDHPNPTRVTNNIIKSDK